MKKTDYTIYNDNQRRYEIIMRLSDYLKENNYEVEYNSFQDGDYFTHALVIYDENSENMQGFEIELVSNSNVASVSSEDYNSTQDKLRLFELLEGCVRMQNDTVLDGAMINVTETQEEFCFDMNKWVEDSMWLLVFNFLIT